MKVLRLEQTDNTPHIQLDLEQKEYLIKGESRPENVSVFYLPLMEWFEEWGAQLYYGVQQFGEEKHTVKFQFEYFNSSSAKYIMDIILKINEINNTHENIKINIEWLYDEMDEDIKEAGEEFEDLTSVPFTYREL